MMANKIDKRLSTKFVLPKKLGKIINKRMCWSNFFLTKQNSSSKLTLRQKRSVDQKKIGSNFAKKEVLLKNIKKKF